MIEIKLLKRSGGFRNIVKPSQGEKKMLRQKLQYINLYPLDDCVHGFRPGRSPVSNALEHLNKPVSICFDLKDFFDSVTLDHLRNAVNPLLLKSCLYKGIPAQGLPTSPALANIGARDMDRDMLSELKQYDATYTRYADDMTISGNFTKKGIREIKELVNAVVNYHGFTLNHKKTKVLYASSGRREICGVSVGCDIRPLSRHKKKLRALRHLKLERPAEGMAEWCRLRPPKLQLIPHGRLQYEIVSKLMGEGGGDSIICIPPCSQGGRLTFECGNATTESAADVWAQENAGGLSG